MCVRKEYRRLGIGRQLLGEVNSNPPKVISHLKFRNFNADHFSLPKRKIKIDKIKRVT